MHRFFSRPCVAGWIAFAVAATILLIHYSTKYGLNVAPSSTGDELSYDNIGWNLSHGRGYAEGYLDDEFLKPYNGATVRPLRGATEAQLVAYRPPLFPFLLSGLDTLFGRQFRAVRTMNALAMAATAGLLVWYLVKTQNLTTAAIGFVLFLVIDTRTRLYGRAILTEATATLLMSIITLLFLNLGSRKSYAWPAMLGSTFGILILDRSMFVLWVPMTTLAVLLPLKRQSQSSDEPMHRQRLLQTATWLIAMTAVLLPWAIRNITVLDRFMPMGTQGMMQLSAGFSDRAVQRQGVWNLEAEVAVRQSIDSTGLTRLETEVAVADESRRRALKWIAGNPVKATILAFHKCWQEYRPRAATEWIITCCAVLGAITSLHRYDTRCLFLLHLINATTIAATWSVEGRFVVPLLLSIHVLAAQGAACVLKTFAGLTPFTKSGGST